MGGEWTEHSSAISPSQKQRERERERESGRVDQPIDEPSEEAVAGIVGVKVVHHVRRL